MKKYAANVAVAYDQLGNALFGGDPQETISSRVGKAAEKGNKLAKAFAWYLNIVDTGHCRKAINRNEGADGIF